MASDRADDENPGCPLVARERVDDRPLAAGVSLREGVRTGCPLAAGGSAEASAGMGEEWTRRESASLSRKELAGGELRAYSRQGPRGRDRHASHDGQTGGADLITNINFYDRHDASNQVPRSKTTFFLNFT
jgi:hypothetical protein